MVVIEGSLCSTFDNQKCPKLTVLLNFPIFPGEKMEARFLRRNLEERGRDDLGGLRKTKGEVDLEHPHAADIVQLSVHRLAGGPELGRQAAATRTS